MTLPKKGSRLITVGGTSYRWRVRHKPTYDQGLGWSPMTFGVQLAKDPSSVLMVTLPHHRLDNWLYLEGASVRPALVARCITVALSEGWAPERPGSAHRLKVTQEQSVEWAVPVVNPLYL
ncbi:hypothetical protein Aple_080960 [Acrocarpospora pleiomorpha]|uniref:Uncharacterized protein n=1 Tax=Acrocarpospora pleiomorpha TaxID=90975 RepID=A0A5M3XVH3_9ACTN|nr:hypothetical protein [Acrocarpospora pleiomorpha]GES25197.1 hypothetical protein Aple_080960 [Acrocarpospora pleiomorpha]